MTTPQIPEKWKEDAPKWMKEGTIPTPDEWLVYFLSLPKEVQIEKVKQIQACMDDSNKCFQSDHEGKISVLQHQIIRLTVQAEKVGELLIVAKDWIDKVAPK